MPELSERAAAKLLGVSRSSLQDRRRAGLLPKTAHQGAHGCWLYTAETLLAEWEASEPLRVDSSEGGDTLEAWRAARTRRELALAATAEDALRIRRGELVEVAEIDSRLVGIFGECRTKLLGIPSRLRQRCPHLTRADLGEVETLIREALQALAGETETQEEHGHGDDK